MSTAGAGSPPPRGARVERQQYDRAVTAFSVLAALAIGLVQLLDVGVDLEVPGYALAGAFLATWVVALTTWHLTRMEQRWKAALDPSATGISGV